MIPHVTIIVSCAATIGLVLWGLHKLSYGHLKRKIVAERKWGLNICCGATDGGGVNADIACHDARLPRFIKIADIYALPFPDNAFDTVLCSHTIEHVDDPERFFAEMKRVGRKVVLVVPPLWDPLAALNIFEHKWVFLAFRKRHESLPPHIPLLFSRSIQRLAGQIIKA